MKTKNLSKITILFLMSCTVMLFQNCSKVAASDAASSINNKMSDNVATATDHQGQDVPVVVTPAEDVDQPLPETPKQPGKDPLPQQEPPVVVDPPAVPSEELASVCGLDLKTIHNIVDLAQFKNQDVSLDLLKGKTLVYSSDPEISLRSLSIDAAVGRTILCGCKIDKLSVKKGRLEVYQSEIKEIGSLSGKLIKDSSSILPAGY